MNKSHFQVHQVGRFNRHLNIEKLVESIHQSDILFIWVTKENIYDALFEAGIASAFNKQIYVYVQQELGIKIADFIPPHNYSAREVLVSQNLEEACLDFSRIIGRKFTYQIL